MITIARKSSMVVDLFARYVGYRRHTERAAAPSICTVQAPHSAMPHPNFVPVMFSVSRKTQSSGISGGTLTVCDLPFSYKKLMVIFPRHQIL